MSSAFGSTTISRRARGGPTYKGDLLDDGYAAFDTDEREFNDGEESCTATLTATDRANKSVKYLGETGKGAGHAEIHALVQFLKAISYSITAFDDYNLTITCLSKPCCKRCSAVMGLLKIAATGGTYKSSKSMGSTSYSLPPDVRQFLAKRLVTTEQKICDEICNTKI